MNPDRIKEDLGNTWKWLAEGWRQISARATSALTYFTPSSENSGDSSEGCWGLMAADVTDHGDHLVLELEAPGLFREEIDVTVDVDQVIVTGTKRFESDRREGSMHVTERAFGRFQRVIPLPDAVDKLTADGAEAKYKRGVLTIKIPKAVVHGGRKISVVSGN